MGLRSQEDNCDPGYVGALLQAVPFMAALPALKEVMGGDEIWGEEGDAVHRLPPLLSSGHREGEELDAAWKRMQLEAEESARYLGEEVEGVLAGALAEGDFAPKCAVRQKIVERREKVRARLLLQALELHPHKEARPVWSWPERDKHSSVWLLCLPTPDFTMSSQEFSTSAAALLCVPPPCCTPKVGVTIGGRGRGGRSPVCKWGDNVVNSTMRGDGCRTRHDTMKLTIKDLHTKAGIPIVCEVFNLFADAIPQQGLSRIEQGRRRQAIVPDFKLRGRHIETVKRMQVSLPSQSSKTRWC